MISIWIGIITLVYVGIGAFIYFKIRSNRYAVLRAQERNLQLAKEELQTKSDLFKQIFETSLGLVRNEDLLALDAMLEDLQASIKAEKGKHKITETELESIEIRLRELGELKRELEVSNVDALREVEMLKSQEKDLISQNEAIDEQLKNANDQIDILFDMFANDQRVQDQFSRSREEIKEVLDKLTYYQQQITVINEQYVVLKKAYDALDIEYAQLYEKRQQMGDDPEEDQDTEDEQEDENDESESGDAEEAEADSSTESDDAAEKSE